MIQKPSSISDIKNLPEVITLTRDFFPFVAGTKIYKYMVILDKNKAYIPSNILLRYSFSRVESSEKKALNGVAEPIAVKVSSSEFDKMISEMSVENKHEMSWIFGATAFSNGLVKVVYSPEGSDFQFSLEQVSNENWFSPLND